MIDFLHESLLQITTYLFLVLSLSFFWITKDKRISFSLFLISIVVGLLSNGISYLSLISIIIFGALIYLFYKKNYITSIKVFLFFSITTLTVLTFSHKVPGYHNWQAFKELKLSKDSAVFDMWFNFDKPLIAFFLLLFIYNPISKALDYKEIIIKSFIFSIPTITILFALSLSNNYIIFDPKLPSFGITIFWIIKMLFFTVIAEEFFFRYFIQNNLTAVFKKFKHAKIVGLVLTSLVFGLFHLSGGLMFAILAFVSSLFYGGVYIKTKYIESAILLHFIVNSTHFFLFSYPYYSQAIL